MGLLHSGKQLEISLHAIIGSQNPKTMRLKSKIGNQWVIILVDSRSTYNFLDLTVLSRVPLPVVVKEKIKVKIANGDQVDSMGKVLEMNLNIQGEVFNVDMYMLVLANCDMILGVHWLQALGPILWNFNKLTM